MNLLACIALGFAALQSWSLLKKHRPLEYLSKPAVMTVLFIWLWTSTGLEGASLWFGLGILFSLAGDVILMLAPVRLFLAGLIAFLLAHVAYFLGLNIPPAPFNMLTVGIAVLIILAALPLIRRILQSLVHKGLRRLVEPVRYYATVIALMLFSALMTLFRTDWLSTPAYLVSAGAVLFVASDLILAWNKFVRPIRQGRLVLMITYHLGQMALIAGAVMQFG